MADEISPLRGQVWVVTFAGAIGGEVEKTRPALIISNDTSNALLNRVQVVPISSGPANGGYSAWWALSRPKTWPPSSASCGSSLLYKQASLMRAAVLAVALLWRVDAAARVQPVVIPDGDVSLQALYESPANVAGPAVVALHVCGGPFPARDRQWREVLLGAGHPVLFPDSFGSRGLGPQCELSDRGIRPDRERGADTVAAVQWLRQQKETPPGGAIVLGWSNGGSTVLAAAAEGVMPTGAVRGFVAFYPGCRIYADRPGWAPSAPLLILIGAADDWTPAEPCRRLAARFPDRITLIEYPGAYHDFDAPNRPIRTRTGLAYTAGGNGVAHTGTNEPAREDAISRVLAFLQRR